MATDEQVAAAWQAYEDEYDRWGSRVNKARAPYTHEIVRRGDDDDPQVMVSAVTAEIASHEFEGLRAEAAIKAALLAVGL